MLIGVEILTCNLIKYFINLIYEYREKLHFYENYFKCFGESQYRWVDELKIVDELDEDKNGEIRKILKDFQMIAVFKFSFHQKEGMERGKEGETEGGRKRKKNSKS